MMDTNTDAQIFLADQRGRSPTDFLESYHTFNFGPYVAEGREPFGPLHLLNDDTLRAGASITLQVEQPTEVWLLPLAGGLEYTRSAGVPVAAGTGRTEPDFLEPGQVGRLSLVAGMSYTVTNPYETETINLLQIWFAKPPHDFLPAVAPVPFDLRTRNTLLPLYVPDGAADSGYRGFIGQYGGRQEGTYTIEQDGDAGPGRVFVFVLQGAFEVANRLLHEKDGLALQYPQDDVLDFEALSNDAILLLIDLRADT